MDEVIAVGESFADLSLKMALPILAAIGVAALLETIRWEKWALPYFQRSAGIWLHPAALLLALISPL